MGDGLFKGDKEEEKGVTPGKHAPWSLATPLSVALLCPVSGGAVLAKVDPGDASPNNGGSWKHLWAHRSLLSAS